MLSIFKNLSRLPIKKLHLMKKNNLQQQQVRRFGDDLDDLFKDFTSPNKKQGQTQSAGNQAQNANKQNPQASQEQKVFKPSQDSQAQQSKKDFDFAFNSKSNEFGKNQTKTSQNTGNNDEMYPAENSQNSANEPGKKGRVFARLNEAKQGQQRPQREQRDERGQGGQRSFDEGFGQRSGGYNNRQVDNEDGQGGQSFERQRLQATLGRDSLKEMLNYLDTNNDQISDIELKSIIWLVTGRIENESAFNLRALKLQDNVPIKRMISFYENVTTPNNVHDVINFLTLATVLNEKNIYMIKRDGINRHVEQGKKMIEDPECKKKTELASILGIYTSLNTKSLLTICKDDISQLKSGNIARIFKKFALWQKSNLRSNQLIRPLLEAYSSFIQNESPSNSARMFRTICEIDSKVSSEATARAIKEIGNNINLKTDEKLISTLTSVMDGLAIARSPNKVPVAISLHNQMQSLVQDDPQKHASRHLIKYLSLLSKFNFDVLNSIENVDNLVAIALKSPDLHLERVENIIQIATLMRIKKVEDKIKNDYLKKTFDMVSANVQNTNINEHSRNYRVILKTSKGALEKFSQIVAEKVKNELSISGDNLMKMLNLLVVSAFYCDDQSTDSVLQIVVDKINKTDMHVKQAARFIDTWISRQEYLQPKYKQTIGEALLKKIKKEQIAELGDRDAFKLFTKLNDLQLNRNDENLRKHVFELSDALKEVPNFKENLLRNLQNSIIFFDNRIQISNSTLGRSIGTLRNYFQDKNAEFRQLENLLNIVYNLVTEKSIFPTIQNETLQSVIYLVDSLAAKKEYTEEINLFKFGQIFRALNSNQMNCRFLTTTLYKRMMKDEEIHEQANDKFYIISELLDSPISKDEKVLLIKKIANKIVNADFNSFSPFGRPCYVKIIGLANRLCPEIVSDEIAERVVESAKSYEDPSDRNQQKFSMLTNLAFFKRDHVVLDNSTGIHKMIKDLINDTPIRIVIKKLEDLSPAPGRSLTSIIVRELATKYQSIAKFDKHTFTKVFELMTRFKYLDRDGDFYTRIFEFYGKNFDSFFPHEHVSVVSNLSRIFLGRLDVVSNALEKISIENLDETGKLSLANHLTRLIDLDNKENSIIIKTVKDLLSKVDLNALKEGFILNPQMFLALYYTKIYFPEYYQKNHETILQRFNASYKDRAKYISVDDARILRKLSIFEKFDPEIQRFVKEKTDRTQEYITNNYFTKCAVAVLKQFKHDKIVLGPEDLACQIYLPDAKLGIIMGGQNAFILHSNGKANYQTKIAIEENKAKGVKTIVIGNSEFKDLLNNSDSTPIFAWFETLGIPNLNLEKKYDFTDFDKIAFSNSQPAPSEELGEDAAEEVQKKGEKIKA